MNTKKKLWPKLLIALLLLAAVLVAGYFAVFHNADVLSIENGKVKGMKTTWLIGRFAENGGAENYYKLGDVSAPRNFVSVKDAPDPDGDPITTFFAYQAKDPQKDPGFLLVTAEKAAELPMLDSDRFLDVGGKNAYLRYLDGEEGRAALLILDSPYEDARIVIRATRSPDASEDELLSLVMLMAEKVTLGKQLSPIAAEFKLNFLDDSRWQYLWNGLGVTLEITLFAVLIGIVIGVIVATVRSTWDQNQEGMRKGPGRTILSILNKICKVYLTVIRGTPVVIQLMIAYYIILASTRNGVMVAIFSFGINSGAYVAEIIRGGIMSIDHGQLEAGRSLGFNYVQTMWHIVIPQAMKNVLPALANEFIVLLKETSVAGYVAVKDLTKGGDIIRGVTYSAFMPLLAVAAIYLVMVMFFTWLVGKLERRLRSSDH